MISTIQDILKLQLFVKQEQLNMQNKTAWTHTVFLDYKFVLILIR